MNIKKDWHISDLSLGEKSYLLKGIKSFISYEIPSIEIIDVCIIGSRAFPDEYKHLVREDSDIDVIVKAKFPNFYSHKFLHKTMFYDNPMHIMVYGSSYDCRYHGIRKFPIAYYSLVTHKHYIPEDKSYILKHIYWKYGVETEAGKCTSCGKKISVSELHLVQMTEVYSKTWKVGVLCDECYSKFQNAIKGILHERR